MSAVAIAVLVAIWFFVSLILRWLFGPCGCLVVKALAWTVAAINFHPILLVFALFNVAYLVLYRFPEFGMEGFD